MPREKIKHLKDYGWDSYEDPKSDIYVIQNIESGLYIYKPNQWGNTLTDDPRKAKTYTSEGMAKKSLTHGIDDIGWRKKESGKWKLVKVENIVLGDEKIITLL